MSPGAGEGTRRGQAQRHLGVRLRPLRDAHRPTRVRGRRCDGHARRACCSGEPRLAAALPARCRRPSGDSCGDASRRIGTSGLSQISPMRRFEIDGGARRQRPARADRWHTSRSRSARRSVLLAAALDRRRGCRRLLVIWPVVPSDDAGRAARHHAAFRLSVTPADEIGGVLGRRIGDRRVPDGRTIVSFRGQNGQRCARTCGLSDQRDTAAVMPGTEGAPSARSSRPTVSGSVTGRRTRCGRCRLGGGPPVVVAVDTGDIWCAVGTTTMRIVFARRAGGLLEVPSSGGTAAELTTPEPRRSRVIVCRTCCRAAAPFSSPITKN